jgi:hypothetical protein
MIIKMKYLFLVAGLFCGSFLFAQHTATVTGTANFKTAASGLVVLDLKLDNELKEAEVQNLFEWLQDNEEIAVVQVDGVNVSVSIVAEVADRNPYDKAFHMMHIENFIVTVDGVAKTMTTEQMFNHFNM